MVSAAATTRRIRFTKGFARWMTTEDCPRNGGLQRRMGLTRWYALVQVCERRERLQFTLSPRIFRRIVPRHRSTRRFGRGTGHLGGRLSNKYLLKLYVAGSTPRATLAIDNLKRICETDLSGRYELQIIDVLKQPELAEQDKVLATPTLIKQLPPPLRRVIGDLSDADKVLLGLELRQIPPAPSADQPSKS